MRLWMFSLSLGLLVGLSLPALAQNPPQFTTKWGVTGMQPALFTIPAGVAVGLDGSVYVSDFGNSRVQRFDADGVFISTWGTMGSAAGEFNQPHGIAVDDSGNVYVADVFNHRVQKFDAEGNFILQWGSNGTEDGQFRSCRDVTVDSDGYVYAADQQNKRIQKFDRNGVFVLKWGQAGSEPGNLNGPQHIESDPSNFIYVTDAFRNVVIKYASDGSFVLEWGGQGTGDSEFRSPRGIAIDESGMVYVCDGLNNLIKQFDENGNHILTWGGTPFGTEDGDLNFPEDIAVTGDGIVYLADSGNDRMQRFDPIPEIVSVSDVGNDNGRQVLINFLGSSQDGSIAVAQVTHYEVYRRIDPLPGAGQQDLVLNSGAQSGHTVFLGSSAPWATQDAGWEYLASSPAHGQSEYNIAVSTAADSTEDDGVHWSVYFIRAASADPTTFFDSTPDSGYSHDDLAPNVPENFRVASVNASGDVELLWDEGSSTDVRYFSLHSGSVPDFVPGEANLIARVVEMTYTDVGGAPEGTIVFYKLSATDFSGNMSDYAVTVPSVVSVVEGERPARFALYQNIPNPFQGQTILRFDLPVATSVQLAIYDTRGRLVRTLQNGGVMPAGSHQRTWDRRDQNGTRVPAGTYFYSLRTPGFTGTEKAIVLD